MDGIIQWINSMWPVLLMVVIFYFLLYRPQRKEQKKRTEMLESLKKDTKVVTIGGIHGTIVALNDDTVTLRVADKVEMKFARSAINQVLTGKSEHESK